METRHLYIMGGRVGNDEIKDHADFWSAWIWGIARITL